MTNDQVRRMAGKLSQGDREKIESEVEREVAAAFAFAEDSLFPDETELTTDASAIETV